ncbi:hypothetical protein [Coraliomargarita parva]|uniref:hypothetical protein n=1 Tax=Coraliomargarita parva TaxID=3014050 RepID=UPI0022B33C1C|nr:hypothetical protein [Coraliomargarita parva]
MHSQSALQRIFGPASQAFKTYWAAILAFQLMALAVVLCYYWVDGSAEIFARIAEFKQGAGLVFAAISTLFSGGVIPEIFKFFIRPKDQPTPSVGELGHQLLMWAWLGVLVDLFYRLQTHLFGEQVNWQSLLIKTSFDQLVFTPLVTIPLIVSWFMLREVHYNPAAFIKQLHPGNVGRRLLPVWATSLIFWPVTLMIVYALPPVLQFPLYLFANAAFSILMIFILRRPELTEDSAGQQAAEAGPDAFQAPSEELR